jgi:hypothetical protein
MNNSHSLPVFAVVFTAVYAVVYVVALEKNYALFTYHPALNEFGLWVEQPRTGPAMYWYGWMATSGIVALLAGVMASLVPERLTKRLWSGWSWAVPVVMMLVVGNFLRGFFISRDADQAGSKTPRVEQAREVIE